MVSRRVDAVVLAVPTALPIFPAVEQPRRVSRGPLGRVGGRRVGRRGDHGEIAGRPVKCRRLAGPAAAPRPPRDAPTDVGGQLPRRDHAVTDSVGGAVGRSVQTAIHIVSEGRTSGVVHHGGCLPRRTGAQRQPRRVRDGVQFGRHGRGHVVAEDAAANRAAGRRVRGSGACAEWGSRPGRAGGRGATGSRPGRRRAARPSEAGGLRRRGTRRSRRRGR